MANVSFGSDHKPENDMVKKIAIICVVLFLCACGTTKTGVSVNQEPQTPEWVRDPYLKYDRNANVAAIGSGSSREAAEKSAFGNLVAIFGQSIQVDERVSTSYDQVVRNGALDDWSEGTAINNVISTSASLDSLVGAEIGEVWGDNREYYAVAVLNKAKARQIYSGLIASNQTIINNLVNIPAAEKNTLDGFARYQLAALVADITTSYGNLLSVIGAPAERLKLGDEYRLEAINIAKAIPISIRVQNDLSGRVQGAFAKVFSNMGFQSGGSNSRYILDANIITSVVEFANNPNKWTRIEVNAYLVDSRQGAVLLPYNYSDRQGHTTQAEANNRAYAAAERKINEEYSILLNDYFSQLLPKN